MPPKPREISSQGDGSSSKGMDGAGSQRRRSLDVRQSTLELRKEDSTALPQSPEPSTSLGLNTPVSELTTDPPNPLPQELELDSTLLSSPSRRRLVALPTEDLFPPSGSAAPTEDRTESFVLGLNLEPEPEPRRGRSRERAPDRIRKAGIEARIRVGSPEPADEDDGPEDDRPKMSEALKTWRKRQDKEITKKTSFAATGIELIDLAAPDMQEKIRNAEELRRTAKIMERKIEEIRDQRRMAEKLKHKEEEFSIRIGKLERSIGVKNLNISVKSYEEQWRNWKAGKVQQKEEELSREIGEIERRIREGQRSDWEEIEDLEISVEASENRWNENAR